MGRGNCGLPTAAWDPIHGDQIPGWVIWTDMAQLRSDRERLPSLSERGQGLAALGSSLLSSFQTILLCILFHPWGS